LKLIYSIFIGLLAAAYATVTVAQEFRVPGVDDVRAKRWDMYFSVVGSESESTSSSNGSGLEIDSDTGWGFGIAYNLNQNIALGFEFSRLEPSYTATLVDENDAVTQLRHKMDINSGQFKGTWNILNGSFTPYIDLGLGWTHLDSNLSSSPPTTGCWWDPFWGWVCSSFYDTYSDTNFSYSGGLGLRWEITPNFLLRGSYNRLTIDMSSAVDDPDLSTWRFDIGTSF
jgi:opacity protein-like surface antigen